VNPRDVKPSRREYLAGVGAAAAALGGCLGLGRGSERAPPERSWSTSVGASVAAHAVSDRGLFVVEVAGDDAGTNTVARYDAQTGSRRWGHELEAEARALHVEGARAYVVTHASDDPRTEAEDDGYGELLALTPEGDQRWRRALPGPGRALTSDDTGLYVGTETGVLSFDRDGATRWRADLLEPSEWLAADRGSVFAVSESRPREGGAVTALDAATGERGWRRTHELGDGGRCPPVADDERVYVPDGYGLLALDRAGGEAAWFRAFGDATVAALGQHRGALLVATGTEERFGTVYGLEAATGRERSEHRFETPVVAGAFREGRSYVLLAGGTLAVVGTGVDDRVDLGWDDGAVGRIAVHGHYAYVAGPDGSVARYAGPGATEE
jgi:outer membrane protein assembly factor BamB